MANMQAPKHSSTPDKHAGAGRKSTSATTNASQGGNTKMRGFASMDPEVQRRIASEGGRASHLSGRGHIWTSEEAREAGRKGGKASQKNNPSSKPNS